MKLKGLGEMNYLLLIANKRKVTPVVLVFITQTKKLTKAACENVS